MIPLYHLQYWSSVVPWVHLDQVEQDLVISRALIELYQSELLRSSLVFRGGTALHKLYFPKPFRYSEDIDLVDVMGGDNGEKIAHIRQALDHWLGKPQYDIKEERLIFRYKFISSTNKIPLKLKVEINAHENFYVFKPEQRTFFISSEWISKKATIPVYCLEELLATKLRALYQRKKGRDLFDIYMALNQFPELDTKKLIDIFKQYLAFNHQKILQEDFMKNLALKIKSEAFQNDIIPLLPKDIESSYDPIKANKLIQEKLISLL